MTGLYFLIGLLILCGVILLVMNFNCGSTTTEPFDTLGFGRFRDRLRTYGRYYFPSYYDLLGQFSRYCTQCGWKTRTTCSDCNNCGFCIDRDGVGKCEPGDSRGPYFREDCVFWEYKPFVNNIDYVYNMYPYRQGTYGYDKLLVQ